MVAEEEEKEEEEEERRLVFSVRLSVRPTERRHKRMDRGGGWIDTRALEPRRRKRKSTPPEPSNSHLSYFLGAVRNGWNFLSPCPHPTKILSCHSLACAACAPPPSNGQSKPPPPRRLAKLKARSRKERDKEEREKINPPGDSAVVVVVDFEGGRRGDRDA